MATPAPTGAPRPRNPHPSPPPNCNPSLSQNFENLQINQRPNAFTSPSSSMGRMRPSSSGHVPPFPASGTTPIGNFPSRSPITRPGAPPPGVIPRAVMTPFGPPQNAVPPNATPARPSTGSVAGHPPSFAPRPSRRTSTPLGGIGGPPLGAQPSTFPASQVMRAPSSARPSGLGSPPFSATGPVPPAYAAAGPVGYGTPRLSGGKFPGATNFPVRPSQDEPLGPRSTTAGGPFSQAPTAHSFPRTVSASYPGNTAPSLSSQPTPPFSSGGSFLPSGYRFGLQPWQVQPHQQLAQEFVQPSTPEIGDDMFAPPIRARGLDDANSIMLETERQLEYEFSMPRPSASPSIGHSTISSMGKGLIRSDLRFFHGRREAEEEAEEEEEEEDGRGGWGWDESRQPTDMSSRLTCGVDGGPSNPELLQSFRDHIAYAIWNGHEPAVLDCNSHAQRLRTWKIKDEKVLEFITASQLAHLRDSMFRHINMPLISAFVERWQPETNSFHLPFGEMTITLHDVWYILRIPVTGHPIISTIDIIDTLESQMSILLGITPMQMQKEWRSGTVKFSTIYERLSADGVHPERVARGYLLWMLGATLFIDKNHDRLHAHFLPFFDDLFRVDQYAWGAATLAFLYHHLGRASRAYAVQMSACLTLLEAWIYEYFPEFQPSENSGSTDMLPRACRWVTASIPRTSWTLLAYRRRLDQMTADEVHWTPFGRLPHHYVPITLFNGIIHCMTITEPYMPDRVMRQFGLVQIRPASPFVPIVVYRGSIPDKYKCIHDPMLRLWYTSEDHLMRPSVRLFPARFPAEVASDYMEWFLSRTHPRISPHANDDDDDDDSSQMSDAARLQLLAVRAYPLHEDNLPYTDKATFWQCLRDVTEHLEDLMGPRGDSGGYGSSSTSSGDDRWDSARRDGGRRSDGSGGYDR